MVNVINTLALVHEQTEIWIVLLFIQDRRASSWQSQNSIQGFKFPGYLSQPYYESLNFNSQIASTYKFLWHYQLHKVISKLMYFSTISHLTCSCQYLSIKLPMTQSSWFKASESAWIYLPHQHPSRTSQLLPKFY